MRDRTESIFGAITGCAVGDSLGLPYEGLSHRRAKRMLGEPDRHRFLFGRGMVSDDTEHTWMTGEALCQSPNDVSEFARQLGWKFRWWLLGIPAGIGLATLRAILKLWVGFSHRNSGVRSAGNGPAMRSAILGAAIDDLPQLHDFVEASTRITHTDRLAFEGAFAVAVAAWCCRRGIDDPARFFSIFREQLQTPISAPFQDCFETVLKAHNEGASVERFCETIGAGRGVSGFIVPTVAIVLFVWFRSPGDYRSAVKDVICSGGDTDTTGAILGAIIGARAGIEGVPKEWIAGLAEWPRGIEWSRNLAIAMTRALEDGKSIRAPSYHREITIFRNFLFAFTVLCHGFRRLFPPY